MFRTRVPSNVQDYKMYLKDLIHKDHHLAIMTYEGFWEVEMAGLSSDQRRGQAFAHTFDDQLSYLELKKTLAQSK